MNSLIELILSLPKLTQFFQELVLAYLRYEKTKLKDEFKNAVKESLELHDQRPIENALTSDKKGERSNVTDSSIVDSIPFRDSKPSGRSD